MKILNKLAKHNILQFPDLFENVKSSKISDLNSELAIKLKDKGFIVFIGDDSLFELRQNLLINQ